MKREREYKDYIMDIIQAIDKIEEFIRRLNFQGFKTDEKTVFAVLRALEIIGEAAKMVPFSMRSKYKQIPWGKMAGMRNKLIHEYFGVNIKVIWKTIKKDLPKLKPLMAELLRKYEQNG